MHGMPWYGKYAPQFHLVAITLYFLHSHIQSAENMF